MDPLTPPGLLILDQIRERGLGTAETAEGLGITRERLYRLIEGRHGITPELAASLAAVLGGTAENWLRIQVNYDFAALLNLGAQRSVQPFF